MEAEKINTHSKLCKLRELWVNLLICKMGIAVVTISEAYDNLVSIDKAQNSTQNKDSMQMSTDIIMEMRQEGLIILG